MQGIAKCDIFYNLFGIKKIKKNILKFTKGKFYILNMVGKDHTMYDCS
jgi:hypothetical protein